VEVTAEAVDKYVTARLDAKYKPATINRHTQLLSQAFNLAVEREHLSKAPPIRKLSEKGNVRQGFLADAEFHEIRAYLPAYLYDYSGFDYLVGWRKGEVSSLLWEDMDGDEIRLRGVNSKNEAPRLVLGGELAEIIERRRADRWVQAKSGPVMSAYVFHLKGCPVGDFKKAWRSACVKAGLGRFECKKCGKVLDRPRCRECRKETKYYGPLYHDFRRTAARNMIRAGVPEKVAMAVTGHKTRSMFDRYNIVNGADLREAMDLTQAYLKNGGQRPHRTAVMAMEATAK
jgi:integrase